MPMVVDLKNFLIGNGTTTSNAIGGFEDAEALVIYAPAALTGTVTLQVAPDREASERDQSGAAAAAIVWATMQSGGSDITIPAGKALTLTDIGFRQMRLVSGSAEGADRTFKVSKQVYPTSRG